nr:sensor histidine kinase [Clostridium uliginosum]
MFILSILICSLYPTIKNMAKQGDNVRSPYESISLLENIHEFSYVLYKDVLEKEKGQALTYDQVYIKENTDKTDVDYNLVVEQIKTTLNEWSGMSQDDLKNLNYLVLDKDGKKVKTNTNNNLDSLLAEGTENASNIENLNKIYDWYMVVNFDEKGVIEVKNVHGAYGYNVRNSFSNFSMKEKANIQGDSVKFNPIVNTTFVYAIPKDLKYSDFISKKANLLENNVNFNAVVLYVMMVFASILILSLVVPYKKGKEVFGIKSVLKIPFEINCFIFGCTAFFSAVGSGAAIFFTLDSRLVKKLLDFNINTRLDTVFTDVINIGMWIVIIYLIFVGAMLLKHIFTIGIVKYFKENLLIIKILRLIKKFLSKVINYVAHIDLTEKSNKFIIKVIGLNLIIMSIFCMFWFLGVFLSFIYSIVLFYLLRKYYTGIKNKFGILLDATNKIAEGNLDVQIQEDLGVFNPFKEEVERIQMGFKNAVDEEVKSQKMKTELISNVSHDLKTPLTSIITYIDLLKDENINEEDRKSYIDTLDKKSQRLKFLIEDLFEVSKATSGNVNLNLVNVDIVELMRQIEIELEDKIKKSGLIFRNNFPENKSILQLDSQKTFRIFENLLSNISKYAMKNSRVYIDILEKEESVEITLKNMSAVEIDFAPLDIVERFERGDKSRNTEGSGLGLAIAKSFVELQGGNFNIDIDGDLFKVIIEFKR